MGISLTREQALQKTKAEEGLAGRFSHFWDTCLRRSKYILILSDFVALLVFLRMSMFYKSGVYFTGVVLLLTIWAFISFFKRTYTFLLIEDAEIVIRRVFYHWLTFSGIAWILYYILFTDIFRFPQFLLSLLFIGAAAFTSRLFFLSLRKKFKHLLIKSNKIAIIGDNPYARQLIGNIKKGCSEYHIEGCYNKDELKFAAHAKGQYSDIYHMARKGVKEIYCCLNALTQREMQLLLSEADRYMIRVRFLPDSLPFGDQIRMQTINKTPVFVLRSEPLLSDKNKLVKRGFDITFSLFVIVFVLSWLTPLLWIIIKCESKGPLFFKQKRTGIDNHTFKCLKFRSMVSNAASDTRQASKKDDRVTRVGAFLRKTSMDELPQFFNVLKGDMSVVGPRPHMLFHTDQYREKIGSYMIRHYVKPGITGLAQISGYRGETKKLNAMKQRVEHDIDYVENWTFMLDLKIIFLTIWNLGIPDENAY